MQTGPGHRHHYTEHMQTVPSIAWVVRAPYLKAFALPDCFCKQRHACSLSQYRTCRSKCVGREGGCYRRRRLCYCSRPGPAVSGSGAIKKAREFGSKLRGTRWTDGWNEGASERARERESEKAKRHPTTASARRIGSQQQAVFERGRLATWPAAIASATMLMQPERLFPLSTSSDTPLDATIASISADTPSAPRLLSPRFTRAMFWAPLQHRCQPRVSRHGGSCAKRVFHMHDPRPQLDPT
eukprot:3649216-Rhodomonas_salina.6